MRRIKLLYLFLSATPRLQEKAGHAYVSAFCLICLCWWCSMLVSGRIYFAGIIEKGGIKYVFYIVPSGW